MYLSLALDIDYALTVSKSSQAWSTARRAARRLAQGTVTGVTQLVPRSSRRPPVCARAARA